MAPRKVTPSRRGLKSIFFRESVCRELSAGRTCRLYCNREFVIRCGQCYAISTRNQPNLFFYFDFVFVNKFYFLANPTACGQFLMHLHTLCYYFSLIIVVLYFPKNELRRIEWIKAVRLERRQEDWLPNRSSKVCSIHFDTEDMYPSRIIINNNFR